MTFPHPRRTLALACAAVVLTACSGEQAEPAERTGTGAPVAIVNGEPIARVDFDNRLGTVTVNPDVRTALDQDADLLPRLSGNVLGQMIDAELITQHAPTLGVSVTDQELTDYIDQIVRDDLGGGPDAWQRYLDSTGYPESEVRLALRQDLLREQVEDVLALDAGPTETEVAEYHRDYYAGKPFVRHILLAEEDEALAVLADLRGGADFADLARERSVDHESSAQGGDLGPFAEGEYPGSFEAAVEAAKDGTTTQPVQSAFGWHVIQRLPALTLAQAHGTIVDHLREVEQDERVVAWVAELRTGAEVEVAAEFGDWNADTGTVTG